MHELSLMSNLLAHAAAAADGAPICALRVRVGPLSGVVVAALRFAFEALAPDTPAAGARLDVAETVPVVHCLRCGATDGELRGGHELELISIEVPDHV